MGYGFVQLYTSSDTEKALKLLQRKQLDDHCLELKRSTRATQTNNEANTARKKSALGQPSIAASTKLVVRNIPFEANAKEVEDIFKTFGALKKVRLPIKATGSHRGFAFVDFYGKEDAKKAFDALCHRYEQYFRNRS